MTAPNEDDFRAARVLPVIDLDDADKAVPLADALMAGGLNLIELTLRSPAALPALKAVKAARPHLIVGMGTILSPENAAAAVEAGADFLVTPGATDGLLAALARLDVPTLPGVATMSEAMAALDAGFSLLKFFPAEAMGGAPALKAFAGPLPAARFCPTGGITAATAADYLALPNVVCCGGSWVAPAAAIRAGDWAAITANARRAQGA